MSAVKYFVLSGKQGLGNKVVSWNDVGMLMMLIGGSISAYIIIKSRKKDRLFGRKPSFIKTNKAKKTKKHLTIIFPLSNEKMLSDVW